MPFNATKLPENLSRSFRDRQSGGWRELDGFLVQPLDSLGSAYVRRRSEQGLCVLMRDCGVDSISQMRRSLAPGWNRAHPRVSNVQHAVINSNSSSPPGMDGWIEIPADLGFRESHKCTAFPDPEVSGQSDHLLRNTQVPHAKPKNGVQVSLPTDCRVDERSR
jgi:hypothetical protein